MNASIVPALAAAMARAGAFAATMPVVGSGAVPRIVRGALALVLVPALVAHIGRAPRHAVTLVDYAREAAVGASFGVAASIVAAAASAAGTLVDSSLAMRPSGRESVFGGTEGPFGRLYALAFAAIFLSTGSMTRVCARFIGSTSSSFEVSARGVVALAAASVEASLDIAAPAIAAQTVATLIAAVAARAAPRINGLSLASPLATAMVVLVVLVGAGASMHGLVEIARRAAAAAPL